jgi:hypothetical protein
MATPTLVSIRDFNTSRYAQLADTTTANMNNILASAESAIESMVKRPLRPTVFSESFTSVKDNTIYLKRRPIISVSLVQRGLSLITTPVTIYSMDVNQGILTSPYFRGYNVTVDYTAGFTVLPDDLKEAILMQAALFTYQDLEMYGSGDSKPPGILYIKEDIKQLIAPYKQLNTAFTY